MVHDLASFPTVPQDTQVVVHGHSHRWSCIEENGIWYVNPGIGGSRRFNLPITLGIAVIEDLRFVLNASTLKPEPSLVQASLNWFHGYL